MIINNIFEKNYFTNETASIISSLTLNQKYLFQNTFKKKSKVLNNIFNRFFPIYSKNNKLKIIYCNFFLKSKKKNIYYCKNFLKTDFFSIFLKLKFSFFKKKENKIFEFKRIIKNIYFCDIPYMFKNTSFIINGIERTVVSQLYKNPCVSVENKDNYYILRLIPLYGLWLEFFRDKKRNITVSINNSKKIPLYLFFISIDYPLVFVVKLFSKYKFLFLKNNTIYILYYNEISYISKRYLNSKKIFINGNFYVELKNFLYKYIYYIDVFEKKLKNLNDTIKYFFEKYEKYNKKIVCLISKCKSKFFKNYLSNYLDDSKIKYFYFRSGLNKIYSFEDFIKERKKIFFSEKNFFLTNYSRKRLNNIIGSLSSRNFIDYHDIYNIVFLFKNKKTILFLNIDKESLAKKKIRGVGNQIENIFSNKMYLLKKIIFKKISKISKISSSFYLFNNKLITHAVNEFFCVSQYCQFLDQNNILSEITHKRRISSIGKKTCLKGSSMESLRKIHYSSYGRICPIETPEGINIGLVNSYSLFCFVDNDYFLSSPYLRIKNKIITGKIFFLKAENEINVKLTGFNSILNEYLIKDFSLIRKNHNIYYDILDNVKYMDISLLQIFSLASMMIPFIEHDDVNRALMGSNMQRQSIPSIILSAPYVSTGLEYLPFIDLKYSYYIRNRKFLIYQDSKRVIVSRKKKNFLIFKIIDFFKYVINNQKNLVNNKIHDFKKKINNNLNLINDNNNTYKGYLSLGQNVLTTFLSFKGYNFEDSIIVSERLVKSDVFTTLHSNIFILNTDYKDKEYIYNKKIFKINKRNYKKISKNGFAKVGMHFSCGDIIAARIEKNANYKTSSGYDNLLNSILCNKIFNYKNDFVKLDYNNSGILYKIEYVYPDYIEEDTGNVINDKNNNFNIILNNYIKIKKKIFKNKYKKNKIFFKERFYYKGKKNLFLDLEIKIANNRIYNIKKSFIGNFDIINTTKEIRFFFLKKKRLSVGDKMSGRHGNKGVISKILPIEDMPFLKDGTICDMILNPLGVPTRMNIGQIYELNLGFLIFGILERIKKYIKIRNIKKIKKFLKSINFNFNDDNNIYDINYYRKNITISFLPFNDNNINIINDISKKIFNKSLKNRLGINKNYDKVDIYDGYNGLKFDNKASFGYMYFLKLHHTSYDKIHARSVGPYSLITQQPLKGKSRKGGQRVGEMEVWALEAYGASYVLREMLTVKSDDIFSRRVNYNNIIFGKNKKMNFFPDSFNILISELKSLCFNLNFL
ncbi:DNA-directed RNA polymerase subunit beta [Candidatus Vidania fulgoroideorum]